MPEICEESDSSDFSDDDKDNELDKILHRYAQQKRICIKKYYEDTVTKYTDVEFLRHYCISRSTFKFLEEEYAKSEVFKTICKHLKVISPGRTVAVFLCFAGHECCSYRDLADQFDLSLSSVYAVIHE